MLTLLTDVGGALLPPANGDFGVVGLHLGVAKVNVAVLMDSAALVPTRDHRHDYRNAVIKNRQSPQGGSRNLLRRRRRLACYTTNGNR